MLLIQVLLMCLNLVGQVVSESPAEERVWHGFALDNVHVPYYALLVSPTNWNDTREKHIRPSCGATIIHARWVITTVSCVDQCSKQREYHGTYGWRVPFKVFVGIKTLKLDYRKETALQKRHMKNTLRIITNSWYEGDKYGREHDLALIYLDSALNFNSPYIKPVRLPTKGSYQPMTGDMFMFVGFGARHSSSMEDGNLYGTPMRIKNHNWCMDGFRMTNFAKRRKTVSLVTECAHLCADGNGTHVCEGDFGGGLVGHPHQKTLSLVTDPPKTGILVGIMSWTPLVKGCGYYMPSVFTRVTRDLYIDWIQKTIANHG